MNHTVKFVLAAMLGSALTLGIFYWTPFNQRVVKIEHVSAIPTVTTRYTDSGETIESPLDFTLPAAKVTPAVVNITSTIGLGSSSRRNNQLPDAWRDFFGPFYNDNSGKPQVGIGSGVIISEDGYIVTNNHVIEDASDIEVLLFDNRTFKAKLIGTDPSTDLALIKISERDLPFIQVGNSDNVKVGEWVLAVGNPFRLNSTVTAGIVSAIGRSINILGDREFPIESFIQTDAAVNPGNSGGALVDLNGNLIGINTAIATRSQGYQGYSFAVPSNIMTKVIEDLLEFGEVQRGFIGAEIINVNGNIARERNLSINEGVLISKVQENGAAKEAGLQEGDVVTQVDGVIVKNSPKLLELLGRKRPGDDVQIKVNRYGEAMTFDVKLKSGDEIGGVFASVTKENDYPDNSSNIQNELGVQLRELDEEEIESFGISSGLQVTELRPGIISRSTDLREGFIITHINREPINSLDEFEDILQAADDDNRGVMLQGRYSNSTKKHFYAFGME